MTIASSPPQTAFAQTAWQLTELIREHSAEAVGEEVAKLELAISAFEKLRGKLNDDLDAPALLDLLRQYEALVEKFFTLGAFVSLWFSSDTQSQSALTQQNRVQQALAAANNRILFFDLWWKGLDEERAAELMPCAEQEPDLAHFLRELRRLRPYSLDEAREQLINLKDADGMEALLTLYSMLTNRLEFQFEIDGKVETLTRDALIGHAYSGRPEVRQAAYQELYRVYRRESAPLAQIYASRVRDWYSENVQIRGFDSPIAVRNIANDIPDAAVEALLQVSRENAPLFQRYFKLKAKCLGLERLRRYDLYAPLANSEKKIPYAEGVQRVLDTFGRFHPKFAQLAERVFNDNHIDSEIRKGKRGGAFCASVLPSHTPWVLVNYTGRLRDVQTIAHELGHAIHSMLAAEHSVLTQRSSLPLAETASVFAEILMTDRLLAEESDPRAKAELLASSIDDIYATVLRQTYFVLFEIEAHQAILAGKSPDELNAIYQRLLAEQFGDSVELTEEFYSEWLSIPHIYHTPFYCYAYSFGQLLVLALYRRYQQEGEAFKPGYLKLLAAGGAARPHEILSQVGVDVTDPDFWRGGFEVIRGMIDELEVTLRETDFL